MNDSDGGTPDANIKDETTAKVINGDGEPVASVSVSFYCGSDTESLGGITDSDGELKIDTEEKECDVTFNTNQGANAITFMGIGPGDTVVWNNAETDESSVGTIEVTLPAQDPNEEWTKVIACGVEYEPVNSTIPVDVVKGCIKDGKVGLLFTAFDGDDKPMSYSFLETDAPTSGGTVTATFPAAAAPAAAGDFGITGATSFPSLVVAQAMVTVNDYDFRLVEFEPTPVSNGAASFSVIPPSGSTPSAVFGAFDANTTKAVGRKSPPSTVSVTDLPQEIDMLAGPNFLEIAGNSGATGGIVKIEWMAPDNGGNTLVEYGWTIVFKGSGNVTWPKRDEIGPAAPFPHPTDYSADYDLSTFNYSSGDYRELVRDFAQGEFLKGLTAATATVDFSRVEYNPSALQ